MGGQIFEILFVLFCWLLALVPLTLSLRKNVSVKSVIGKYFIVCMFSLLLFFSSKRVTYGKRAILGITIKNEEVMEMDESERKRCRLLTCQRTSVQFIWRLEF